MVLKKSKLTDINRSTKKSEGVKIAFDKFFQDKTEPIIELSGSQCLIVKT